MLYEDVPIDIAEVLADAHPKGVIHVGAFMGEELPLYVNAGVEHRCWIEADPVTFNKLKQNIPKTDLALNFAIGDKNASVAFTRMTNGASSSLLTPYLHLYKYPDISISGGMRVRGRTLDRLVDDGIIDMSLYDMLLLDIQGAEGMAINGFVKHIDKINYIVSEVNYEELYDGCILIDEFDKLLLDLGFEKQWATIHITVGWGDAYYKRTKWITTQG
jgi:FkbM family methyltransferase